jgi:hypothetical protein
MVILVVDALRFDFARYNLPLSIGARIEKKQMSSLFHAMSTMIYHCVLRNFSI